MPDSPAGPWKGGNAVDNLTGSMKDLAFATSPREFDLSYSTTIEEIMEKLAARRAAFQMPFQIKGGVPGQRISFVKEPNLDVGLWLFLRDGTHVRIQPVITEAKMSVGEDVADYVVPEVPAETKEWQTTFLLCLFLGGLGVHRYYVGKIGTGILYTLTAGLFGIGFLVDFIKILCGKFTDKDGNYIQREKK